MLAGYFPDRIGQAQTGKAGTLSQNNKASAEI